MSAASRYWSDDEDTDRGRIRDVKQYVKLSAERAAPEQMKIWQHAWDEFFAFYAGAVRRYVMRFKVPVSELDDCCQEVCSEVVQSLADFEHSGQRGCFRHWLFLVVRSKTTDVVRRWTRQRMQSLEAISRQSDDPCDLHPDAAEEWERMWEHDAMTSALPLLREQVTGDLKLERDYEVLRLRLVEGLSVAEVAAIMNLTRQAVYTKNHEMRERLKSIVLAIAGGPADMDRA